MSISDRLETAPYGAYAVGLTQTIVFWNPQAERILGYEVHQVLGRKCYEVLQGLTIDGNGPFCVRNCPGIVAARGGRIPPIGYAQVQCASGQRKQVAVIPLVTADEADRSVLIHMFHEAPAGALEAGEAGPLLLTPRELEVLRLLALGLRPAEAVDRLSISVHTVRKHISNTSEKLHSHGMMSAVLAAQRRRLI